MGTKWKEYPNTNNMAEQERYNHGIQHLTTKSEKPQEDDIERDSYPCPTCRKEFLTDKALSRHRTMKQLCRIQWQKDKQTPKTCPYTSCQKDFSPNNNSECT